MITKEKIDESIKHEEEIANEYEKNAKHIREKMKSDIALSNADNLEEYARQHRQLAEWLKELKKFKEQEPCEDCVSREKAIAIGEKLFMLPLETEEDVEDAFEYFKRQIKDLPPVTPTGYKMKPVEQEPCDDCVSRQAVLDKAYAYGDGLEPEGYCVNVEDIQALPPIHPKAKVCKWIKYDYRTVCPREHDVDNPYWRIPENRIDTLKYCPYCGGKIEVEK